MLAADAGLALVGFATLVHRSRRSSVSVVPITERSHR
jgi:hypothetical protein